MDYVQLLQKRLQTINESNIEKSFFDEFFKLEDVILEMQRTQIDNFKGFDGKRLNNKISLFSKGKYREATQGYADENNPYPSLTGKSKGEDYNFVWGGDFMGNFRMKRQNKGLELFSTGTGSGAKQDFFEGYTNMFGLDKNNTSTIEGEVMYYVLDKILTKLYL